jgi:hypothetical protein
MRVIRGPARVPVSHTHRIVRPRGPDGPAQASVAVICREIEFANPTSTKRSTGRLFVVAASGTPGGVPTPFGSMGGTCQCVNQNIVGAVPEGFQNWGFAWKTSHSVGLNQAFETPHLARARAIALRVGFGHSDPSCARVGAASGIGFFAVDCRSGALCLTLVANLTLEVASEFENFADLQFSPARDRFCVGGAAELCLGGLDGGSPPFGCIRQLPEIGV